MPDVVLYGGKGGVGKTTCAAATGLGYAHRGEETLVVSTDPAHSLADAYGTAIGSAPTGITGTLSAVEVDPSEETDRYEALFEALAEDLDGVGVDLDESGIRELFRSGLMPGSDQLAALTTLDTYAREDRWDRVVFDTAPTGHTLRLLDLPDAVGTGVETALSLRDQVSRKADAAKTMFFGPYATMGSDDDEAAPFSAVLEEMDRVATLLRDPERTAFRVVSLPERMVFAETERLVAQLRDAAVPVGGLVLNRVLTDVDKDCARCSARREEQQAVVDEVTETFPDLDVVELPDLTGMSEGRDVLDDLASRLASA